MTKRNALGILYIVLGLGSCYLSWILSVPQPVQWLPWVFGLTGAALIFAGLDNL